MTKQLDMVLPDDWHLHLRDGPSMVDALKHTCAQFGRAIVMPNLKSPVVNAIQANEYAGRIKAAIPSGVSFQPLMTIYLTDLTTPQDIIMAKNSGVIAAKLYPAGATTNSDSGVTNLSKMDSVFSAMAECGMPLLLHGEVTDHAIDIFDREATFVRDILQNILKRHLTLKIVLEHITTEVAARFVMDGPKNLAATVTAHHLLVNRNAMLAGGIRPHLYCLPILKREADRQALIRAVTSGSPRFFLGTDSAPHPITAKESACGCAGCFTAHAAMELYAEVFDGADALGKLEGFASFYGPDFYGLPRNTARLMLEREERRIPTEYAFGTDRVRPFRADEIVAWHAYRT
jgi:dihydroorotase